MLIASSSRVILAVLLLLVPLRTPATPAVPETIATSTTPAPASARSLTPALASAPASAPAPSLRVELTVPAFTAYLSPDADAVRMSANRAVLPFPRNGSRIAWWGRLTTLGALRAAVAVRVPPGTTVTLTLTVGTQPHNATIIGSTNERRVEFGDFTITDTGYVRFELRTTNDQAAVTTAVKSLLLDGPAAYQAHFNLDARRNAASVHLRYATDSNTLVTGFYNEVTAVDDPVNTYYMATGFARGYFGMQVNSLTERRIIFSVWDAADGRTANDRSTVASDNFTTLVAKGENVDASVFGNEGTGGHSHLVYNWKTGSTQRFFVTAAVDGNFTTYSGYWFHPEKQAWQLIASFKAAKDGKGLRRLYSFSENFGGSTGHLRRKALFGNQWIRLGDGTWQELPTATFSHDATGKENRLDRFMGVENGAFFLSHGGFVRGFTESGAAFTRSSVGTPPVIVLPRGGR